MRNVQTMKAVLHVRGCGCTNCRPPCPADANRFGAKDRAAFLLAGLAFGAVLVAILDATGLGPRIFNALGLL